MVYNRNSNKMQLLGFIQGEDWDPCEKCTYFKIFINLFLLHILICVWTSPRDPVAMQCYSTLYLPLNSMNVAVSRRVSDTFGDRAVFSSLLTFATHRTK